jgi:hypothetical protein
LSIETKRPRKVNPWVRRDEVIGPCMGTTFNSLGEAYDFYNLYSWEHGFGIRYGKNRLNAEKTKCMKGIVCGCSLSQFIRTDWKMNPYMVLWQRLTRGLLFCCFVFKGEANWGEYKVLQMNASAPWWSGCFGH